MLIPSGKINPYGENLEYKIPHTEISNLASYDLELTLCVGVCVGVWGGGVKEREREQAEQD